VPNLIALKNQKPLARGRTQSVYQHPDDASLLIKVRDVAAFERAYNRKLGGLIGYQRKHGYYNTWMRELRHYFSVCLRLGYNPQFLQDYRGVANTDCGLGLVVGKVVGRSGELAPTLAEVVKKGGFSPDLRAKVEEMSRQFNDCRINTNDVSPNNIVYGWNESIGDHLVLIEGIGVNTFIPLAKFSNYFNVRSNNRHFARTMRWLETMDRRYRESIENR
jgi:hypothetical protein